jgi:hypothetical protein
MAHPDALNTDRACRSKCNVSGKSRILQQALAGLTYDVRKSPTKKQLERGRRIELHLRQRT